MTLNQLIPKNWRDITLEQYQELKLLEYEDHNLGNFEYIIEQLAIILDTDSEDEIFDDIDIDELLNIINNIKWLRSEPKFSVLDKIDEYTCRDLNKITLGEFLDLEHYFKDNYYLNLHYIASIFYQRQTTDMWGNKTQEPYIYDLEPRAIKYQSLPITYTVGLIDYYIEWKENLLQVYENVFADTDYDKIDNEEQLDAQEIADIKKEIAEEKKKTIWSWEAIIYELSGNNITNYDEVFNTPLILIMNTLSMKKTLNI